MFYDLEEPNKFIKDAADSLDENGIFIAQLMCLKSMIDKNDLGNICHEHIEFYSLKSLKYLFEKNGFEVQTTGYFVVYNATLERDSFDNKSGNLA